MSTSALISAQAQDAADKGISGVPTFVFAQKYAVSGAQPAEQLARAIRQVSAEVNAQAAEYAKTSPLSSGASGENHYARPCAASASSGTMAGTSR